MGPFRFIHRNFSALSQRDLYDLMVLREDVFVVGQKITAELEIDGLDPECVHIIGFDADEKVVATARLFMNADPIKIGRIAVSTKLQGEGVGTELMHYVHRIMAGRPGLMSAQAYLEDWYTRLGWQREGEIYDEAEIPHIKMVRPGTPSTDAAREIAIDVGHTRLAARAWGDPDAPPILALHGWLDNAATFDGLAPLLADHYVVAVDFPGHGYSTWRAAEANYHFIDWVVTGFEMADALGWDQFSVLGHSMGAGVASLMAGCADGRIHKTILIEGLGPLSNPAKDAPANMTKAIARNRVARRGVLGIHSDFEAALKRRIEAGPMAEESARILLARGTYEVGAGVRFSYDPKLRGTSYLRMEEAQVRAFLGAITSPVLLIRARSGWDFNPAMMKERLACVPDATLHSVDGGHHVHLDTPEAVAQLIDPFLAGEA